MLNAVELFAGAGGLAMGASLAGFKPRVVIERDRWACDTIRENANRGYPIVQYWQLHQGDVREFDYSSLEDRIDLVAGGPPCQPFSVGGKHGAFNDERDMFPTTVAVIRRLRPKAFILENVRGLTRRSFANYFEYIRLQLTYPEIARRSNEDWEEHLARLSRTFTSKGSKKRGLTYKVQFRVLNAADYGVPQKRDRVFLVGFRSDIDAKWTFPEPTHSLDALLESQWITGEYWDQHGVKPSDPTGLTTRHAKRIDRHRQSNLRPIFVTRPWRTVRDALIGLPDPTEIDGDHGFYNHRFQPGARTYKGHTGSPLDLPAKALKAGDHGVPGGENMMVLDSGGVRYFSVREAARIQTFPDGYVFHGAWSETMRQLGNAVPVKLAHVVANSVAAKLAEAEQREIISVARNLAR